MTRFRTRLSATLIASCTAMLIFTLVMAIVLRAPEMSGSACVFAVVILATLISNHNLRKALCQFPMEPADRKSKR